MKAAVIEDINRIAVKDVSMPTVMPGTALIKVAYGGLCGPTDDAIVKGLHPRATFPLILCHELSGTIHEIGPNERSLQPGDRVVVNPLLSCGQCELCREGHSYVCKNLRLIGIDCDGGFAEYCLVPAGNLVKLHNQFPLHVAALSEPFAVGIHAVRESGLRMGDTAVVLGAGPIGLLVAEACRIAGAKMITIVDINPRRLELASSLGYEACEQLGQLRKSREGAFDVVFETTGSPAVLKDGLQLAKIKGMFVVVGKFDDDVLFDLHTVLFREIAVKGVRVYHENEFLYAMEILSGDVERYNRFISDYFSLDQIQEVFDTFDQRKNLARIMVVF